MRLPLSLRLEHYSVAGWISSKRNSHLLHEEQTPCAAAHNMEYKRCSSCIPGLGALTGYYQPGQLIPVHVVQAMKIMLGRSRRLLLLEEPQHASNVMFQVVEEGSTLYVFLVSHSQQLTFLKDIGLESKFLMDH
ncbi:hypothetical protein LAZ67_10002098 [Cordylochernes scorpioides]|uniref:Uncharacterized protein n=1 Tax=Cordylochernes scorpioides TaxID=51811 RepID=A0ABY6KWC4_9ARAC|nr:hypothetical protein LAZ67_10002098 [Cordylochernes scorpioides]